MFTTLGPGAIGIKEKTIAKAIDLAAQTGFEGVLFDIREARNLADEHGTDHVRDMFGRAGVRPGYWGVPVAYRADDRWRAGVDALPAFAALAAELGCPWAATGIAPGSDDLAYEDNFAWHVERLRPIAEKLADAGCRLGIEFIGPKTFRSKFKHEFVYTLGGTLDLARAIGTGNVGLLLDAWHLYTSGGRIEDVTALTAGDVVVVHVNDAPAGIAVEEQIDDARSLPLETGVIDLAAFMRALATIGFDGPVMPEPFSRKVDELAETDPLGAAKLTADSMRRLWKVAGLS